MRHLLVVAVVLLSAVGLAGAAPIILDGNVDTISEDNASVVVEARTNTTAVIGFGNNTIGRSNVTHYISAGDGDVRTIAELNASQRASFNETNQSVVVPVGRTNFTTRQPGDWYVYNITSISSPSTFRGDHVSFTVPSNVNYLNVTEFSSNQTILRYNASASGTYAIRGVPKNRSYLVWNGDFPIGSVRTGNSSYVEISTYKSSGGFRFRPGIEVSTSVFSAGPQFYEITVQDRGTASIPVKNLDDETRTISVDPAEPLSTNMSNVTLEPGESTDVEVNVTRAQLGESGILDRAVNLSSNGTQATVYIRSIRGELPKNGGGGGGGGVNMFVVSAAISLIILIAGAIWFRYQDEDTTTY